jgi:hypothetical protein
VFSGPVFCCWSSLSSCIWLSQFSLSFACLASLSVPSCVDLPLLYVTLVQLSFYSGWEEFIFCD